MATWKTFGRKSDAAKGASGPSTFRPSADKPILTRRPRRAGGRQHRREAAVTKVCDEWRPDLNGARHRGSGLASGMIAGENGPQVPVALDELGERPVWNEQQAAKLDPTWRSRCGGAHGLEQAVVLEISVRHGAFSGNAVMGQERSGSETSL